MRRKICVLAVLALLVAVTPAASADPDLETDIEDSIVAGLAWLADQQNPDGSFGNIGYDWIGFTGLVVLKFEDRALDLGLDPLSSEYDYHELVQTGLDYIVDNAVTEYPIGVQPAGDPDGDGDGYGTYWHSGFDWHQIYNTGIAMMALSASQHPELYGDLVQDAVDYMSWAQVDAGCPWTDVHRGGWRYAPNECSSDNSTSGYATLGLGFAGAAPPFGFGIAAPDFVYSELDMWISVIQDPVNGDPDDGGSYYDPEWPGWVNILKTGNLLYEMGLVGDTADTLRVQDAVDYIERHWSAPGGGDIGWLDHRQAMFTMMKGLEALGIELLDTGSGPFEWFLEVAQHLVDTQHSDGYWDHDPWGNEILSTAWALLTLEKAVPQFEIPVPVDIKPTSCRNPLNTTEKGVLPVAILGFEDFDVSMIDPASVRLLASEDFEGVAPLRWAYEDVATPYEPFLGKQGAFDCTTDGPDGFMDLTFKFKTQEVVAALGEVADGDVIVVPLVGNLLEEFGGTPIVGEDVIVILKKGKK